MKNDVSIFQRDYSKAQLVHITTPVYVPLFIGLFLTHLKKQLNAQVIYYNLDAEIPDLQAELSTSFLGQKSWYLIFVGAELPKLSKELSLFFDSYMGPHGIFLMTGVHDKLRAREQVEQFSLPATCDAKTYSTLSQSGDPRFSKKLFSLVDSLDFDQACLFNYYQLLVGKNSDQFFDRWFHRLIIPQHSLFTLSQYFFARDGKNFFALWQKIQNVYPIEFWTSFWSEQLWQAIRFCVTVHEKGLVQAKQLQLRLPFSFMQKDWQKHNHRNLATWHNNLYEIDFTSKNGSIGPWLDLWYAYCLSH